MLKSWRRLETNRLPASGFSSRWKFRKSRTETGAFERRKLPENSRSVPLRGTLEVNLYGLLGIGDVKPAAVALPAFGKHLNEHAAKWRVGDVCNPLAIGLHIQFQLFVFPDCVLFNVFEIDAGILDRRFLFSTAYLDGDARLGVGLWCSGFGRWRRRRR